MRNYTILLISICLMSGQLMTMQRPQIERAEDLLQLALECAPKGYEEKLQKYAIDRKVLCESVAMLMGDQCLSSLSNEHSFQNDDRELAEQIMSEFYLQKQGYILTSDAIKYDIYAHLKNQIHQKQQEIDELDICSNRCLMWLVDCRQVEGGGVLYSSIFLGLMLILDIMIPVMYLKML